MFLLESAKFCDLLNQQQVQKPAGTVQTICVQLGDVLKVDPSNAASSREQVPVAKR